MKKCSMLAALAATLLAGTLTAAPASADVSIRIGGPVHVHGGFGHRRGHGQHRRRPVREVCHRHGRGYHCHRAPRQARGGYYSYGGSPLLRFLFNDGYPRRHGHGARRHGHGSRRHGQGPRRQGRGQQRR